MAALHQDLIESVLFLFSGHQSEPVTQKLETSKRLRGFSASQKTPAS
jgi:hypothetical protein